MVRRRGFERGAGLWSVTLKDMLELRASNRDTKRMKILFVAGFGPIIQDQDVSKKLYKGALGTSSEEEDNGYMYVTLQQDLPVP